jgi:trans-aconitate 2-methyltransferase
VFEIEVSTSLSHHINNRIQGSFVKVTSFPNFGWWSGIRQEMDINVRSTTCEMPWDPQVYNQFKNIRFKPFFDLMALISGDHLQTCVDIGCGTGEQTSILAQRFENASFVGIDSSEEMLSESKKFENEKLNFKFSSIETFSGSDSKWDLVFSNAALQWSEDHCGLFPKLISKLNKHGQFAVQMPFQKENILNRILLEIVNEKPFVDMLKGFRQDSPLLKIDEYSKIMFDASLEDLNIFLKVYPIIAKDELELYSFISGSALIPYMERLDPNEQELLRSEFITRIKNHFGTFPAIYSFKRILLYGVKV